jgi:hypothetical protein
MLIFEMMVEVVLAQRSQPSNYELSSVMRTIMQDIVQDYSGKNAE